ncbi:hypothetical protein BGX38DRAFT_1273109 [Terfezia claveryi]|nr:hypothetical protein BGX38DRAFT_1273109 [Terfezia claveryi]
MPAGHVVGHGATDALLVGVCIEERKQSKSLKTASQGASVAPVTTAAAFAAVVAIAAIQEHTPNSKRNRNDKLAETLANDLHQVVKKARRDLYEGLCQPDYDRAVDWLSCEVEGGR